LELGQASEFAGWFDIAWDEGEGRLLLPWLPAPLADLVADADLALRWDPDTKRLYLHSGELRVPLGAATYASVVAPVADHAANLCGSGVSRDSAPPPAPAPPPTAATPIAAHATPTTPGAAAPTTPGAALRQ